MKKIFSLFAAVLFAGSMMAATEMTCAEAAAAALAGSTAEATCVGYVTSIQTPFNPTYSNVSFWIADAADGGQVIQAYRAACASADAAPVVGDKVSVTGSLTKHNSTPEFAATCTFEIIEHADAPVNLGAKTIAEFLALKNMKDTCILTGVVKNIVMDKDDPTKPNKYGNFDLVDASGSVYIYGLLTPEGVAQQFVEMGIVEEDQITIKAIYKEYQGTAQVSNAILVSHEAQGIENVVLTEKAQKVVVNGVVYVVRDNKMFDLTGAQVR